MSKGLVRKLLILLVGVLLVLLGVLYQIKQNSNSAQLKPKPEQNLSSILTASLQQQRRFFQRCWLKNNSSTPSVPKEDDSNQLTWQIFLKIEPNGKVKEFQLLNRALFGVETEKCLREISYRLKFPSFEGEEIAISVPIVISSINENH